MCIYIYIYTHTCIHTLYNNKLITILALVPSIVLMHAPAYEEPQPP